jgi:hypothetical protein
MLSFRGGAVAIYRLIANGSFGPDEIEVMKVAYESALVEVGITDREDPITELIAKSIVHVTASGERNPKEIMERALNALGIRRSVAARSQNSPTATQEPYNLTRPRSGGQAG